MKLRTPTHGYRMTDGNGKPKGKIHLLNPRRTNDMNGITVCKILIWPDGGTPCLDLKKVVDVSEICQRCLGPCEALS